MKLWQHKDTDRIVKSEIQPSARFFEIPIMYEDELSDDISDEEYSQWFENSFVDFVRMRPKI